MRNPPDGAIGLGLLCVNIDPRALPHDKMQQAERRSISTFLHWGPRRAEGPAARRRCAADRAPPARGRARRAAGGALLRTSSPRFKATPADRIALALLANVRELSVARRATIARRCSTSARACPIGSSPPTAFIAFALANNAGFGMLTGGARPQRLYGAAGV